jgi:hypothetical protein
MVDQFLSRPLGADDHIGANRETRILRGRQIAHNAAADNAAGRAAPYGAARLLVQVYNGGSMASTAEKIYFTHPVLITGAETEGGTATLTADTATTVPVVVLWNAPATGDFLTAYSTGNRWVSE